MAANSEPVNRDLIEPPREIGSGRDRRSVGQHHTPIPKILSGLEGGGYRQNLRLVIISARLLFAQSARISKHRLRCVRTVEREVLANEDTDSHCRVFARIVFVPKWETSTFRVGNSVVSALLLHKNETSATGDRLRS